MQKKNKKQKTKKKPEKFQALFLQKTSKTSFGAHFGPFFVQKLQNKVLPKKTIHLNFNSLCYCNFAKNNGKSSMQ